VNIAVILTEEESGQPLQQTYNGHDSYMLEIVVRNDECKYLYGMTIAFHISKALKE